MSSRTLTLAFMLGALLALPLGASAQDEAQPGAGPEGPPGAGAAENWDKQYAEERHESHGAVTINGERVGYTAVAGTIMIEDHENRPGAMMSYVAYFKEGNAAGTRPVTFIYNGGPGSSTVWLHMGAFGPQRVVVGNGVRGNAAPYPLVNNDSSPLDATDLVFIDMPGTGYGRVGVDLQKLKPSESLRKAAMKRNNELKKEFWGVDEDSRAFNIFIHKFLTKFSRWNSPKFLFGESYGTTRSAVLVSDLQSSGVDVNGVMLLSQILSFGNSIDGPAGNPGNYLPYVLGLPTFAATAWYHKKVPNPPTQLEPFLKDVEHFAQTEYTQALAAGDALSAAGKHAIAVKLHGYIGLPVEYIERANLRISGSMFEKNLLADEGLVVGRLDSRYSGPELDPLSKGAQYDPQSAAISSAYISTFNVYSRKVLGFSRDAKFKPNAYGDIGPGWNMEHRAPGGMGGGGVTNVMPDLAHAMKVNANLKVMQLAGYYDLATPFFTARYELDHLGLSPKLRSNISYSYFESGHMVYVDPASLKTLHDDVVNFIRSATGE